MKVSVNKGFIYTV